MAIIKRHSIKTGKPKEKPESFVQEEPLVDVAVSEKKPESVEAENVETVDLFDLDNIDFSQRQERRRGDRRRGYRRIDDRNLISRAQEEANLIKENAAKEGYKSGIEKATADVQVMKEALSEFMTAKQQVFDEVAPEILDLSLAIAKKIIKKEVEQDPQIIMETVSDVLNSLSKEETKVSIRVSPLQEAIVKELLPNVVAKLGTDARISVVPDENVEEGSCIVYTNNGIVDASLNTQIELITEAMKGL